MPATKTAASISLVEGTGVPVRGNDIDTDRVIPARFMKEVTFENMGQYAFYDARRTDDATPNDHPFNRFEGAAILVVNENFGCGSSREHAPQALMRWGIKGIVGESFAEIFSGNCQSLGIPTLTAETSFVENLQDRIEAHPGTRIALDVESSAIIVDGVKHPASIDASQQEALIKGAWDTTALMKSYMDDVHSTAQRLPYLHDFK